VQDLGAVRLINKLYPGLEIHGSTQMTVHDEHGAACWRDLGCDRVVLARENTLDDIRTIRRAVPELMLESFVHGALCIAYSGQCYMSGMISDRSANRGSCAQSCRKDYVLADTASGASWTRLPDLRPGPRRVGASRRHRRRRHPYAQVEGRKKKPEYVATVRTATASFSTGLPRATHVAHTRRSPAAGADLFARLHRRDVRRPRGTRLRDPHPARQPRRAVLGEVIGREEDELIVSVSQPIQRGDGLGFEHPAGPDKGNRGFGVRSVRTIGRERGKVRQAIQPRRIFRPAGPWCAPPKPRYSPRT